MELSLLGGTPSALSGDQLVASVSQRADDHRLDYPALGDRLRELVERGFVEASAWLLGVRLDRRHRKTGKPVPAARWSGLRRYFVCGCAPADDQRLFASCFAEQGAQPASQAAALCRMRIGAFLGAHAAFLCCGRRPISSRASAM